jgi:hypothetical protein
VTVKVSRWRAFAIVLGCALPTEGPSAGGSAISSFISPLPLGGGGWLVAGDVANDGQYIATTDTYGAWMRAPGGTTWTQIVNCNAMPTANCGYYPRTGSRQVLQSIGAPTAIAACPQDSSVIYMMYNGYAFKSTDHAATWTRLTGFNSNVQVYNIVNGPYRQNGRKAACDPQNSNHAYISSDQNGLFETTDGGATWAVVSSESIPTSTSDGSGNYPNYNIAFDPTSGTCSGKTCKIYVFNYVNTAGTLTGKLYASINGGGAWIATSGGPTTCQHLIVSPLDGVVWLVDGVTNGTGTVWRYTASTFTNYTLGGQIHSVAADPAVSGRIIAGKYSGSAFIGTGNGTAWTSEVRFTRVATDIPWLAWTSEANMSNGDMIFDPTGTNKLVFFQGIGMWTGSPPLSGTTPFTWTSITSGIEQMDPQVIRSLPGGKVLVGVQDRGTFLLTPGTYPSTQNTTTLNGVSLTVSSDAAVAKSNSSYISEIDAPWAGGNPYNGMSTDGGVTWQPFNSFYQSFPATDMMFSGGKLRITLPSGAVSQLTTWANGSGSIVRLVGTGVNADYAGQKYFPLTKIDATHIDLQNSNTIDEAAPGSTDGFFIYVDTNPLSSWNGFYTVTGATNNGSGLIRLSFVNNGLGAVSNGQMICVSNVGGVAAATGCWVATGVTASSLDLFGSSFSGTYTSGGQIKLGVRTGGSIAQSTPTNIILAPSNKSFPQCTTDGGQTWTEMQYPASAISTVGGAATGWGDAYYYIRHIVVADPVTANTFYAYNDLVGIYKFVNCSAPTIQSGSALTGGTPNTATANLFQAANVNSTLATVPGNAGHLYFTSGPQGAGRAFHPSSTPLYRSTDGGQNWFTVPNVSEPISVSFGAIKPGATYPTCFMVGWVNNVYGIWRSTNADQATPTWTMVADYPNGSMDQAYMIEADQTIWNQWYLGLGGSSFAYGRQNFLLKRDLDPASNDNTPMFLSNAA